MVNTVLRREQRIISVGGFDVTVSQGLEINIETTKNKIMYTVVSGKEKRILTSNLLGWKITEGLIERRLSSESLVKQSLSDGPEVRYILREFFSDSKNLVCNFYLNNTLQAAVIQLLAMGVYEEDFLVRGYISRGSPSQNVPFVGLYNSRKRNCWAYTKNKIT